MRNFKGYFLFIIFTMLLTACAGVEKEKPLSNKNLTIESYHMSENEGNSLKLITGIPSGLASTNYSKNNMTISSFSLLVDKKVTLEKKINLFI
ncbi:MAG TPA: hypothetical protein VJ546_11305 [Bacillales bacterium]|nr:hypothetical protein [Bacillales bacterium]